MTLGILRTIWQRDIDRWSRWSRLEGSSLKTKFSRHYHIPERLFMMKLKKDWRKFERKNLCWKWQLETGTFLHCIWESSPANPFWKRVMDVLSSKYL